MSTVDRCIAIAAHGRRCQQSTYRGGPYCWHHTRSRKVPAPSRARTPVRGGDAAPRTREPIPVERIAGSLSDAQLRALARFLDDAQDGVFRIQVADGRVVEARALHTLPYPRRRKRATHSS